MQTSNVWTRKLRAYGAMGTIILAAATTANAAIRRVNPASPGNGPGTATDWSDAYTTLQGALAAAGSGDQIWVVAATYKPATKTDSFGLKSNVAILGGFTSGDMSVSDRDPDPASNNTVLSGDLGTAGTDAANCNHVVVIPNTTDFAPPTGSTFAEKANLDGFTITMGWASGGSLDNCGAGIYAVNSSSTTTAVIRNCVIKENYATTDGGGFFGDDDTTVKFRKCDIRENHANGSFGGGLVSHEALILLDSTIQLNTCANEGGGIGYYGGSVLTAISCTFSANVALQGGAIAVKDGGTVITLLNSKFINNAATVAGGGVLFDGAGIVPTMINCTMSGNSSTYGGAWFSSTSLGVDSNIKNSILWGNTASEDGDEIYQDGGPLLVSHSDVRDRDTSAAVYGTVTWVGTPDSNIGEDTTAHDPDFVGGSDYHLQCGSPCMNTGSDAAVQADSEDVNENGITNLADARDRDLLPRIIGQVDRGAYEKYQCLGNADGYDHPSVGVNVDDILAVVNSWGACVDCTADIAPPPCGDDVVNVDDLLQVINNWGKHCASETNLGGGVSFTSVQDCLDFCTEFFEPYGDKWDACVNECVANLE